MGRSVPESLQVRPQAAAIYHHNAIHRYPPWRRKVDLKASLPRGSVTQSHLRKLAASIESPRRSSARRAFSKHLRGG